MNVSQAIAAIYEKTPISFVGGAALEIPSTWTFGLSKDNISIPVPLDLTAIFSVLGGFVIHATDYVISDSEISFYPHANMNNACQGIIKNPKRVSLEIQLSNVGATGINEESTIVNNAELPAALTYLQNKFDDHILKNGWFTVVTRGGIFKNMVVNGAISLAKSENTTFPNIIRINFIEIMTSIDEFQTSQNKRINDINAKVPSFAGVD